MPPQNQFEYCVAAYLGYNLASSEYNNLINTFKNSQLVVPAEYIPSMRNLLQRALKNCKDNEWLYFINFMDGGCEHLFSQVTVRTLSIGEADRILQKIDTIQATESDYRIIMRLLMELHPHPWIPLNKFSRPDYKIDLYDQRIANLLSNGARTVNKSPQLWRNIAESLPSQLQQFVTEVFDHSALNLLALGPWSMNDIEMNGLINYLIRARNIQPEGERYLTTSL